MGHAIEWDLLMQGWNDRYGTTFNDVREFVFAIHQKKSCKDNGKLLGIGAATFRNKIKELGIEPFPRENRRGMMRKVPNYIEVEGCEKCDKGYIEYVCQYCRGEGGRCVNNMCWNGKILVACTCNEHAYEKEIPDEM